MLHLMILALVLLTIAATFAMRRVEEDVIKRYSSCSRHPDNKG
jgi:hypothetical protein